MRRDLPHRNAAALSAIGDAPDLNVGRNRYFTSPTGASWSNGGHSRCRRRARCGGTFIPDICPPEHPAAPENQAPDSDVVREGGGEQERRELRGWRAQTASLQIFAITPDGTYVEGGGEVGAPPGGCGVRLDARAARRQRSQGCRTVSCRPSTFSPITGIPGHNSDPIRSTPSSWPMASV